jgi:hypothetical protein
MLMRLKVRAPLRKALLSSPIRPIALALAHLPEFRWLVEKSKSRFSASMVTASEKGRMYSHRCRAF